MASWIQRVFGLSEEPAAVAPPPDPNAPRKVIVQMEPTGSSGTTIFSGYFAEEYLSDLQGHAAQEVYDKMPRQDARVAMLLSAVRNPILGATWEVEPAGDDEASKLHAEFVEHVLFNDMRKSWKAYVGEFLDFTRAGHSVFEVTHKVVLNHKRFGTYNGLKDFGFRSPRSIERWNLDKNGDLKSITQVAYGDLDRYVDIPAEFLLVFTLNQTGDNYEGISLLRSCYGPWYRKDKYLKLMAIGIEKTAVPTPKAKIPSGKESSEQFSKLLETLRRYTSHQQNFITYPDGWDIDFSQTPFNSAGVKEAIQFENTEMTFAFTANFLELGQTGSGSFALSFDLSDFFLGGIEHIADLITEKFNRVVIPGLIRMNHGEQESYPKLKCSGISDKAGKELAETLKALAESKYLTPDDRLEGHLRKRLDLPEMSLEGQRKVTAPAPMFAEGLELSDRPTPKMMIREGKGLLWEVMKKNLEVMGKDLVARVIKNYESLPKGSRDSAIKDVPARGRADYLEELRNALTGIATRSLEQARREVPKKRNVKLSDSKEGFFLSDFDRLPVSIQKKLRAKSELLVDTQMADLEKAVYFQFGSSVDSVADSAPLLEKDLDEAAEKYVESAGVATAAGNTSATIVNESRNAFFFDEDVLDEIESFTLVNGDPDSPICKDLAGSTFNANDPEAERYYPPLHHNCESFIAPNVKGSPGAKREITGLKPSSADVEKSITLAD